MVISVISVPIGSVWEGNGDVALVVVGHISKGHLTEATCLILSSTNIFIRPGEIYHPKTVSLLRHYKRLT